MAIPRARAAAAAVERLLPADGRTLLDVACGTGIVTARLTARAALPDQDAPRPDPRYRLLAFQG